MKRILSLLTVLALVCLLAPVASAQGPQGLLAPLQADLGAKRYQAALDKTEVLMRQIWDRVPLHLRVALFTKDDPQGFGIYTPRASNVFPRNGKPIYIYLEPVGYKIRKQAGGTYDFGLSMDLALTDTKGTILWGKQNFLKKSVVSHHANREFFLTVTLTLTNVPVGDYFVLLRVKDKNSSQYTEARLPLRFQ